ncbi:hypothetical protein V8F06_009972 [Rhypophila decipiens]
MAPRAVVVSASSPSGAGVRKVAIEAKIAHRHRDPHWPANIIPRAAKNEDSDTCDTTILQPGEQEFVVEDKGIQNGQHWIVGQFWRNDVSFLGVFHSLAMRLGTPQEPNGWPSDGYSVIYFRAYRNTVGNEVNGTADYVGSSTQVQTRFFHHDQSIRKHVVQDTRRPSHCNLAKRSNLDLGHKALRLRQLGARSDDRHTVAFYQGMRSFRCLSFPSRSTRTYALSFPTSIKVAPVRTLEMADPRAPRLINKVEQLTGSDLSMADDLIKQLAAKMKYSLVWTSDTVPRHRKDFWGQVFYRWDTVSGHGQLPQLQARNRQSSTLVGQLSQTLPQTPKKKPRKLAGGHSRAPSDASINAGQHFSEVFLKPPVNIRHRHVRAKSRAIQHWDIMEEDRIYAYTSSMCIYWARGRLLRKILQEVGRDEEADRIPHSEDFSNLETLHTCTVVLSRTAELIKAVQGDLTRTTLNQHRRWPMEGKP